MQLVSSLTLRARLLVIGFMVATWSFQVSEVVSWYVCCLYYVVEYIFDFLVDCLRHMLDHLNSCPITNCPFFWFHFLSFPMDLVCNERYRFLCQWYSYYRFSMFYEHLLEVFCDNFELLFGFSISSFPGRWGRCFRLLYFGQAFVFCRLIKKKVGIVSTNNV